MTRNRNTYQEDFSSVKNVMMLSLNNTILSMSVWTRLLREREREYRVILKYFTLMKIYIHVHHLIETTLYVY